MRTLLRQYLFLIVPLTLAVSSAQAATIIVDESTCTLADAITAVNNDADEGGCVGSEAYGDDTIILEANVSLAAPLPDITSTVSIEGGGHTIDGNNDEAVGAVLRITAGGDLTLNKTIVTGGKNETYNYYESGGGINAYNAIVTLNSSTVSGNVAASFMGGGIYAENSTVTLKNSTVSQNNSGLGGGIWALDSTVTLNSSTVNENDAGDGAGILAYFSTVILKSSTVSQNSAWWSGGGIRAEYSTVTLKNSTVNQNAVKELWCCGGGISASSSTVILNSSTISQNSAGGGGCAGGIEARDSTVTLNNSTVSQNHAEQGGGILARDSTVTLNNSTVSQNRAYIEGGGGILAGGSTVTLKSSIISGNTDNYGASELHCGNSTINADSFNLFGYSDPTSDETNTQAFSGFTPGSSDVNATSDGVDGVLIPTALAAILSPLADNGGPTWTHALPAGSPAIDLDTSCNPGLDQRGQPRPSGAGCDAGSFEFNSNVAVTALWEAVATVNSFDPDVFKNKKQRNKLTRKINKALALIDRRSYAKALTQLQNILDLTDGCMTSGVPDRNDWITDCDSQDQVAPLIEKSIDFVLASTTQAMTVLQATANTVSLLDSDVFKKNKQSRFIRRLNTVVAKVNHGNTAAALKKLQKILGLTDGCAASGVPDRNDWIVDCDNQRQVAPLIEESMGYLESITP